MKITKDSNPEYFLKLPLSFPSGKHAWGRADWILFMWRNSEAKSSVPGLSEHAYTIFYHKISIDKSDKRGILSSFEWAGYGVCRQFPLSISFTQGTKSALLRKNHNLWSRQLKNRLIFLTKNTKPLLFFGLSLIIFDWKILTVLIIKLVDKK